MKKLFQYLIAQFGAASLRKNKAETGMICYIKPELWSDSVYDEAKSLCPEAKASVTHFAPKQYGQSHILFIGKPRTESDVLSDVDDLF